MTTREIWVGRIATDATTTYALLLGASVLAPLLGLPQLVTGTVVNAALLIATVRLGPAAAISIGTLPSLFALMSGQLPAPLAPMVPLIIVGNAILVLLFHAGRKAFGYWVGALTGAAVKFLWLAAFAQLLVAVGLFAEQVAPLVILMMGWPQLVTAVAGAFVAYGFTRGGKR